MYELQPPELGAMCVGVQLEGEGRGVCADRPKMPAPLPHTVPPAPSNGDRQGGHTMDHPTQTLWRMKGGTVNNYLVSVALP